MLTAGTVWCWGENNSGQLGNGGSSSSSSPVQVTGTGGAGNLSGIAGVAAGRDHTCAVASNGSAYCWGANGPGQLGDGTTTSRQNPVQVVGAGGSGFLAGVTGIDGGEAHTCAASGDGTAWCWGKNDKDQLGTNGGANSSTPVQVVGTGGTGTLTTMRSVATGRQYGCASLVNGSAYCWGTNGAGQLGDGTTTTRPARFR